VAVLLSSGKGSFANLGETGRLHLYPEPSNGEVFEIFDSFPSRLRVLIHEAPVQLSVLYFHKMLLAGVNEDEVCRRCEAKCRRIVKQLRADGVLPD
jgi:hypothetical protein